MADVDRCSATYPQAALRFDDAYLILRADQDLACSLSDGGEMRVIFPYLYREREREEKDGGFLKPDRVDRSVRFYWKPAATRSNLFN